MMKNTEEKYKPTVVEKFVTKSNFISNDTCIFAVNYDEEYWREI